MLQLAELAVMNKALGEMHGMGSELTPSPFQGMEHFELIRLRIHETG